MTCWARTAAALALMAQCAWASPAHADTLRLCDATDRTTAADKDRWLQVAGFVRQQLEATDRHLALVARAGLALERFGQRYTHQGIALRTPVDGRDAPWAVRQLYHDCEVGESRLFDQGLAAFIIGAGRAEVGYLSILLLPPEREAELLAVASRNEAALSLLEPRYQANGHAWSTLTQNCNQWLAELLAAAWGAPQALDVTQALKERRGHAQAWLAQAGYEPTVFQLSPWWMLLSHLAPWIGQRDHPAEDIQALRYRVSMPPAIEQLAQRHAPGVERWELCHDRDKAVLRRGAAAMANSCEPQPGDAVLSLRRGLL